MGGQIAWTLRLPDGTEHRMQRWTNPMPTLINDPAFLDATPEGIKNVLKEWEDMRADWQAHHATGAFQNPATAACAPYPYGLKPSAYGAVVTDFVSHTILSLQGYTNLGQIMALRQTGGEISASVSPHRVHLITLLAAQGRIAGWTFLLKNREAALELVADLRGTIHSHPHCDTTAIATLPGDVDLDTLTARCDQLRLPRTPNPEQDSIDRIQDAIDAGGLDEKDQAKLARIIETMHHSHAFESNPFILGHAQIDHAPFTLEEFPETADGYRAMRTRLIELGFALTPQEHHAWDVRIFERAQEEDADG